MLVRFDERLRAAQAGDESSFVELFRSVQPLLLRYLTTIGGDLAEDVASETWMSVVRGLAKFKGDEDGFRAWVFTIARARLTDARRRSARQPDTVQAEEVLEARPDGTDVAGRVEEMFSTEAALKLIARLPRDQAEAVLLRHVAGLDVKEASQVLGKRPGTVRVAAHRGLKRLSTLVEPHERPAYFRKKVEPGCNGIDATIGY
jgi:RNA polymerase sigma-70 factor (ECF subfamily)